MANPQRFLACHRRKVRPVAHPPEAALRPGRQGRRPKGRNCPHPKLSRDLPTTADATPPAEGRCRSALEDWVLLGKDRWRRPKNYSARRSLTTRRGRDLPMTAAATPRGRPQRSLRSLAPLRWRQPKNCAAQRSLSARLGEILPFQLIVETQYFPFKARRAGAARHSNRACRLQPAWSARWRILAKQRELFRQYPTPAVARGPCYLKKRELRSGRAGPAYAAGARP